jgi:hypothetical protein
MEASPLIDLHIFGDVELRGKDKWRRHLAQAQIRVSLVVPKMEKFVALMGQIR